MTASVSLIYARSLNGVIGNQNELPAWKIAGDLARFKELTTGGIVVMGYNTWLSLPQKSRPLKNRINVVLTTRLDIQNDDAENTYFVNSTASARAFVAQLWQKEDLPVWIIGGARIYEQFENYATVIYETVLMAHVDGDAEYRHTRQSHHRLVCENVVPGEYAGKTYNVHHRVWETNPAFHF